MNCTQVACDLIDAKIIIAYLIDNEREVAQDEEDVFTDVCALRI
jgi:hypothetical protein